MVNLPLILIDVFGNHKQREDESNRSNRDGQDEGGSPVEVLEQKSGNRRSKSGGA